MILSGRLPTSEQPVVAAGFGKGASLEARPVDHDLSPSEERILDFLRDRRSRLGASLADANDVLFALRISPKELDFAARMLEARGLLVCAPEIGPVLLLMLARAHLRLHDEGASETATK
jgi:hypothetical protein